MCVVLIHIHMLIMLCSLSLSHTVPSESDPAVVRLIDMVNTDDATSLTGEGGGWIEMLLMLIMLW